MRLLCTTVLLLSTIVSLQAYEKLKSIYSWKALDFAFPNEHARLTAINNRVFIPGSPLPIDVDVYYEGNKRNTHGHFYSSKFFHLKIDHACKKIQMISKNEKRSLLSFQEHKSTVFMAIPRFQNGVPVTLGYVTNQTSLDGNPLITPYPNWTYNDANNCASIISVYRIQVTLVFEEYLYWKTENPLIFISK